ncbi:hypothetical protein B0H17DRAFT_451446 [Mycena rosella]|uniref:F-box domain-containing protein n=1 Tax=Mycena rosella TaxID=1033263 RepID=A0AAD7GYI8_MYCRO|nr:hypothetical protein B0H17DRAFT_451446 [Mycena rosella]
MEETAFNKLPVELERVIFELAAWQYPETVTLSILVARRVCVWIEPLLYHVVFSNGNADRLLQMMQSKPREFLRKHVHHIALSSGDIQRADLTQILTICTNISDLALWTGDTYPALLIDMRHLTHLRRLSINLFELFGGPRAFQVPAIDELPFAHLTHLDVFSEIPESVWPVFGRFPSLTHLSISDCYSPNLLTQALDTCAVLQLLIVVWTSDGDRAEGALEITDPRFCMISCWDFETDWELGAWGGLDYWRRAEDFVARKSRGEIKKSEYQA